MGEKMLILYGVIAAIIGVLLNLNIVDKELESALTILAFCLCGMMFLNIFFSKRIKEWKNRKVN